jgi:hypothetical protein
MHLHRVAPNPARFVTDRTRRSARREAFLWIVGLVCVAVADPASESLVGICLFDRVGDWIGLAFCPGCGLGHSVGWLARGEFTASFAAHPLGVPAIIILLGHSLQLIRRSMADTSAVPSRPTPFRRLWFASRSRIVDLLASVFPAPDRARTVPSDYASCPRS